MDEMNPPESQLQSWTPRRPSPKIARRLFGQRPSAASSTRRQMAWNWLSPVAACGLTMMVAIHAANRSAITSGQSTDESAFAKLALSTGFSSNGASYSVRQGDENLEYNVWAHLGPSQQISTVRSSSRGDVWSMIPTNR